MSPAKERGKLKRPDAPQEPAEPLCPGPFGDRSRSVRGGRLDAVLFATLAQDAETPLKAGIYLRERDLSYLGVEDWEAKWFNQKWHGAKWKEHNYKLVIQCVRFRGEIPCLYSVQLVETPKGAAPVAARVVSASDLDTSFLALVDFVSAATGAGLGLRLKTTLSGPQQGGSDFQTGRRARYRVTPVPPTGGSERGDPVAWVERTELGRGRSSRQNIGAPNLFGLF